MPETVEMVTLTDGAVPPNELHTHADTELSIQDTARWSGYNPLHLRLLDKAANPGFPLAHRKLGSITRLWYARDIAKIIEYKIKAAENRGKKAAKSYRVGNAMRRKARAEKRAAAKAAKAEKVAVGAA